MKYYLKAFLIVLCGMVIVAGVVMLDHVYPGAYLAIVAIGIIAFFTSIIADVLMWRDSA